MNRQGTQVPRRFDFEQLYLGIHQAGGAPGRIDYGNEGACIGGGAKEWTLLAGELGAGAVAGVVLIGGADGTAGAVGVGVP
jgi:hypothetical protein